MYRQARWDEPLIFELGGKGRCGFSVPHSGDFEDVRVRLEDVLPSGALRRKPPNLPEVSEVEVVRHFTRLSQMNWGVDLGAYPLGSCTMKYNPKVNEDNELVRKLAYVHPEQPEETVQGLLEALYKLERWLAEITGMDRGSFQAAAGAHGELVGALMIRAYHEYKGEERDEMIIPDSAHGTNPASAAMAGFKVITVPSKDGRVNLEALEAAVSDETAGIMLTNPNTLGLFEYEILDIARIVHEAGGLLYYDGANLNGIMGYARPGDMGFDIVHLNIHKTFSAPHGGSGTGAGVALAKGELVHFLPTPLIAFDGEKYYWDYDIPHSIGRVRVYYGNIIPLVKAYAYILALGGEGLKEVTTQAVVATNYFISKLKGVKGYEIPYAEGVPRKHEVVVSAKPLARDTGVTAEDVAKALLDRGLHAPTMYFPLIVNEALMIEFTETEPKESIDAYASALAEISSKAYENPEEVKLAPKNTSVGRLDLVKANRLSTFIPSYRYLKRRRKDAATRGDNRTLRASP